MARDIWSKSNLEKSKLLQYNCRDIGSSGKFQHTGLGCPGRKNRKIAITFEDMSRCL